MESEKLTKTTRTIKLGSKVILAVSIAFLVVVAFAGCWIDNSVDSKSVNVTLEDIMILGADMREIEDDIQELGDLIADAKAMIIKMEAGQKNLQSGQNSLKYELQSIRTDLNRLRTENKERFSNLEEKIRICHDRAVKNESRIRRLESNTPQAGQNLCGGNVE